MSGTSAASSSAAGGSAARRAARLAAVQVLYQAELGEAPIEKALQNLMERGQVQLDPEDKRELAAPDRELAADIVRRAHERQEDIDGLMRGALDASWPPERLEAILRAILRAGIAEMISSTATATAFLITDYVDIAHAFYAGREPGMVNAVLDKVAKTVRQ